MHFLFAYFEDWADYQGWSKAQRISYIWLVYLVTAMYVMLVALALRNIWVILLRQ